MAQFEERDPKFSALREQVDVLKARLAVAQQDLQQAALQLEHIFVTAKRGAPVELKCQNGDIIVLKVVRG